GSDNTYTGGTLVSAGILSVSNTRHLGALGTGPLPNKVTLDGGTLRITGTTFDTLDRQVQVAKASTLDVSDTALAFRINSDIEGAAQLSVTGAGAVTVANNNTYIGKLVVSNTKGVTLGAGGATGTVAGEIAVGTHLFFNHNATR